MDHLNNDKAKILQRIKNCNNSNTAEKRKLETLLANAVTNEVRKKRGNGLGSASTTSLSQLSSSDTPLEKWIDVSTTYLL